ncbi:MAG: hypothetical protein MUO62_01500 [Anaerolineales bacterium]|nr:hypothetical protein [Anaerolineales bacterium]
MKIIKNEKLIQRNARIGSIVTISSLVILGIGMYITFTKPEQFYLSILALLVGFLLSQVGIFYTNRWGRKPRPDELLDQALKGLDNRYALYHYFTPVAHVLVGPAGVWTLIPKHQRGKITYQKNRWRQGGGGILQGYLKIFAQEGIGRPDLEIESDIHTLGKFLEKKKPAFEVPEIQAALVFFHNEIVIEADDAPKPTIFAKKLKDFIRKTAKETPLSTETVEKIQDLLGA